MIAAAEINNGNISNAGVQYIAMGGKIRQQYNYNHCGMNHQTRHEKAHDLENQLTYNITNNKGIHSGSLSMRPLNGGSNTSPGIPTHPSLGKGKIIILLLECLK